MTQDKQVTFEESKQVAEGIFKYKWVKRVGITGSVMKKGKGNDIDLVVEIFPLKLKLHDAIETLFWKAWSYSKKLNVGIDIFLIKDKRWSKRAFVKWLGWEDVEFYVKDDFCYFIIAVFKGGNGWSHGWWNHCLDTMWLFEK